jgi:hypothetical protein
MEVSEMLDNMQRCGVVEESENPWSSSVILLRKKNGELRFCMDYKELNDVTKKDSFPLTTATHRVCSERNSVRGLFNV